jgi:hypothetical protein
MYTPSFQIVNHIVYRRYTDLDGVYIIIFFILI